MSLITAAKSLRESAGSMTLNIFQFTTATSGDTFASGLGTSVIDFWGCAESLPNTTFQAGISISNSAGTFTLGPSFPTAMTLFVLSRT